MRPGRPQHKPRSCARQPSRARAGAPCLVLAPALLAAGPAVAWAEQASGASLAGSAASFDPWLWMIWAVSALLCLASAVLFLAAWRRRREHQALREREVRYRELFDRVGDLIFTQDLEGRFTRANQASLTIFGYAPEEMQGMTGAQFMLPAHRRAYFDSYLAQVKAQGYHEGVVIYLDRERNPHHIEYRSTLVSSPGRKAYISGVARDVTKQKMAEKALRRSEERYRALFDSISDFIYTHDLQGRFLTINRAACNTLGYEPEELAGKRITSVMLPEYGQGFRDQYLDQLIRQGKMRGLSKYLDKGGGVHVIEWSSQIVKEPGAEPYVSGSGRDISERLAAERELRRLEQQLTQAQKMEAVGVLAGGIAHDFNNILQVLSGYLQLLLGRNLAEPTARQYLERMDVSVGRAAELVRSLLTFSRKAERQPRRLDLNQEVRQAVALLERTIPKMIHISCDLAPDLRHIEADPTQLEQVLVNLASNAKDAMPEGGVLSLATRNLSLPPAGPGQEKQELWEAPPGAYVRLEVRDSGMGMDRETRERIFEPFFTTKEIGKGTGLGLATVYGIVKDHGGYITCQSQEGQGATFHLYFPATLPGEEKADEEQGSQPSLDGRGEIVLLVDDEPPILEIAQQALQEYGYRTLLAESGEEALAVLEARAGRVDLVILDLGMPGMGGRRCLQQMLAAWPRLKVLIASGYASLEQVSASRQEGAADFIGKPYRLDDLLHKVRALLGQSPRDKAGSGGPDQA